MCRRDEKQDTVITSVSYDTAAANTENAAAVLLALYGPCGVKQYYNTYFRAVRLLQVPQY